MNNPKPDPALNTRRVALDAMQAVMGEHEALDDFLGRNKPASALNPRDRAYLMALCGVTLRHAGQVNEIMQALMRKPLPGKAKRVGHILRLGLSELLFLESAPHGVVHSWVELAARSMKTRPFKGLVNGVLRNADRQGAELLANTHPASNIPEPLHRSWRKTHGETVVEQAAMALIDPPPLDLTLLRNAEKWHAELGGELLAPASLRLPRQGAVEKLAGYDSGDWIVQDVSAALPAQLLRAKAGEQVLDMCAAPGGKSMQLAATGARVTALELNERRLPIMQENLARTGLRVRLLQADAAKWKGEHEFDAILLDAPCSASGIFRHHPDVLYSFAGRDVAALTATQLAMGKNAASLLKPGGRLLYCVCSAQRLEGEDLAMRLVAETALVLDPIDPEEAGMARDHVCEAGWVRIPPGANAAAGGMDAFFMARMKLSG